MYRVLGPVWYWPARIQPLRTNRTHPDPWFFLYRIRIQEKSRIRISFIRMFSLFILRFSIRDCSLFHFLKSSVIIFKLFILSGSGIRVLRPDLDREKFENRIRIKAITPDPDSNPGYVLGIGTSAVQWIEVWYFDERQKNCNGSMVMRLTICYPQFLNFFFF